MALINTGYWTEAHAPAAGMRDGAGSRVTFVDYGKGMCIILVVMMHSTLGVGEAMGGRGWMHYAVEFSKPFRMPDFFLIAGLFLARTIDKPWRRYADRKVLHFAYFYLLWTAIQLTVKISTLAEPNAWGLAKAFAWAMLEPGSTLWFIYLLPVFFIVTRLTKSAPWPIMLAVGLGLETAQLQHYGTVIDEFASRFVYFYAGYRFAPLVFAFAAGVAVRPAMALTGLCLWFVANALAVFGLSIGAEPVAAARGFSLLFGFAGALALIAVAALLAEFRLADWLRWLGARTLIVYLAFFLFMAGTRIVLVKSGLIGDIGAVSALVTLAGVIGPLILAAMAQPTPARYLFERPHWARLKNTG